MKADGVDLSRLAGAYGHRAEESAVGRAAQAADAAGLRPGSVVVDVGGGSGNHAALFAARGAQAVVMDRSPEMARQARERGVSAVIADGAALPVADGVIDLVYFHLSIHHGPAGAWLAEAARIVRPGGWVWVWTLSLEHLRSSFLARWFPRVAELDLQRFPDPDDLAGALGRLGLAGVVQESRTDTVRAGFVSTLHLLDQAEIDAGLAAFAAAHPDPAEELSYTLGYCRVSAIRPSLAS